jgi:hypothetical protein
MPYDDAVVADQDFLDNQPHDFLSFNHVECVGGAVQAIEESGERFGETHEIRAIVYLIGNRFQFGAQGLFTLS